MCTFARSSAGGDKKEFIGCHQVGHALHENWWNQHLEQFIYICSDTLKIKKKKSKTNPEQPKKSSLGKPERKYVLTTEELRRNDAYTQKKKKPKLKMEPQKRSSCVKTVWLAQWMAYEMEEWMKWHGSNRWMDGWLVGWKYGWMEMPADCEPVWLASDSHGMVWEYGWI